MFCIILVAMIYNKYLFSFRFINTTICLPPPPPPPRPTWSFLFFHLEPFLHIQITIYSVKFLIFFVPSMYSVKFGICLSRPAQPAQHYSAHKLDTQHHIHIFILIQYFMCLWVGWPFIEIMITKMCLAVWMLCYEVVMGCSVFVCVRVCECVCVCEHLTPCVWVANL